MDLTTERLIIREVEWQDLDDIFILESSPEVDEYNTLGIPENKNVTREHLRPFIEDRKAKQRKKFCWTIRPQASGEFTGLAGMTLTAYVCPISFTGDVNSDLTLNAADIIHMVNHVFKGGAPPCNVCTAFGLGWTCP